MLFDSNILTVLIEKESAKQLIYLLSLFLTLICLVITLHNVYAYKKNNSAFFIIQKSVILVYVLLLISCNQLVYIQPYTYNFYVILPLSILPKESYIKKPLIVFTVIFSLFMTFFKSDEISKLLFSEISNLDSVNISYENLFSTTLHRQKHFYILISIILAIFCFIYCGTNELVFLMSCISTTLFYISANTLHEMTLGYETFAIITTIFLFFNTQNNAHKSKSVIRYAVIHFLSGFLLMSVDNINVLDSIYLQFDFIHSFSDVQKYCMLTSMLIGAGIFPFSSWIVDTYSNIPDISRIILLPFLSRLILTFILHIFLGENILYILGICTIVFAIIFLLFSHNINHIILYANIGYTGISSLIIGNIKNSSNTYNIITNIGHYMNFVTIIFLLFSIAIFIILKPSKETKENREPNYTHNLQSNFIYKIAITILASVMLYYSPLYLANIMNTESLKIDNYNFIYLLLQISHIILFTLSFGKILVSIIFKKLFNSILDKILKKMQRFNTSLVLSVSVILTIYAWHYRAEVLYHFSTIRLQYDNYLHCIQLAPIIICILGYKFLTINNKHSAICYYNTDYIYRVIAPHILILLNKLYIFIINYLHILFVTLFSKIGLILENISKIRDDFTLKITILSSFIIIFFCIYIRILCLAH